MNTTKHFPREIAGLPAARLTEIVELADGERFELRIGPVTKRIGDATVRMLAYNGSIPGPTLRVRQGSEIEVDVINEGDLEGTVHWHGLRLENRYDGTHETQAPIPVGGRFASKVIFPDPGAYWYHPHIREDYGQELGLYGNILVDSPDPDYWAPAHRELALTLDDVLIEDGQIAPFSPDETNYAAMGRFGNVLLVAGETDVGLTARRGEVVRLYLTNTANTRVFKVKLPGARMKLAGGDSGRVEQERFVEEVVLAPSERVIVDVLFEQAGVLPLEHHTPERVYPLASITVDEQAGRATARRGFQELRRDPELSAERDRLAGFLEAEPDKTLAFVAEMDMGVPRGAGRLRLPDAPRRRAGRARQLPALRHEAAGHGDHLRLPDAPRGDRPGTVALPQVRHEAAPRLAHQPSRPRHDHARACPATTTRGGHGLAHSHAAAGGIEWEDDMVEVNKITTPANTRWKIVDRSTAAENHDIGWQFTVGDRVKIRLVNEMDSDHPMHHPFHIHGAGRFLVLARDGEVEPNLVWKDTVLVRTGETVDILLDVTNPGLWMAHCHIAEHHESGMMFSFNVAPAA